MPLKKSASAKAIGPNIKAEEKAGKPYQQALAIALSTQDEAKKHKHADLTLPPARIFDELPADGAGWDRY